MSTAFQTAVRKNVSADQRRRAIDTLVQNDERTNLAIIVQLGGLRGEFRQYALDGLATCGATERLEELAEDTTLERSLRRRAEDLA